jgi:hypothetical protein
MSRSEKKTTLTIVAGRDGPTEGPHSNAMRIADVAAKMQGTRKGKRGRPRKTMANDADVDLTADRARAFFDMETYICDVTKMGRIALDLSDHPDRELYNFIVGELAEKLEELRKLYYAKGWR